MSGRTGRSLGPSRIARGVALSLSLALGGCAPRSAAPPGYPPTPDTKPLDEDLEPRTDTGEARTFGWFGIAVGADAAVVAIATSAITLGDKSTRDAGCDAAKVCSSAGLNANQEIGGLVGWNLGAWVLAAAGLGVGTVLLLTNPPPQDRDPRYTPLPDSAPKGVSLTLAPPGSLGGLGLGGSF
jgi:hypothetical protein